MPLAAATASNTIRLRVLLTEEKVPRSHTDGAKTRHCHVTATSLATIG